MLHYLPEYVHDAWSFKMKLNAGCGCNFWGDVRLDIQLFSIVFYRKRTSANIIGSVEYLPFKDKVFSETLCSHVLEHTLNPLKCFEELKRVTRDHLLIHVPVFHVYSLLIEAVTLLKSFMLIPLIGTSYFMDFLYKVCFWKKRFSDHKYYIKGSKINWIYFILPLEYEISIRSTR